MRFVVEVRRRPECRRTSSTGCQPSRDNPVDSLMEHTPMPEPTAIQMLLALVDEAFDRKAWHGPTLLGALRGVTPAVAERRPARALDRPVDAKQQTAAYTIRGIAAHDLYHAGQIQLLKRLLRT